MTIVRLYNYFGLTGIASILFWGAALVCFIVTSRSFHRSRFWLGCLGLAVAGMFLAKINSAAVRAIEIDQSAKIEAQRQEQIRQRQEQLQQIVQDTHRDPSKIKFAEDNKYDALDLAGLQSAEVYGTVRELQVEGVAPAAARTGVEPAYRQRGQQQREEGRQIGLEEAEKIKVEEEEQQKKIRLLPEEDKLVADRLDRLNLLGARFVMWLAFILVGLDFLSRFNRTFSTVIPLPFSSAMIDLLSPKSHSVYVNIRNSEVIADYLRTAVRKGESFIYFGEKDPLPGEALRRYLQPGPEKMVFSMDELPPAGSFIYESAWFDRVCFVITGNVLGNAMLDDLKEWLDRRRQTRARAAQTVNLVWDYPEPPAVGAVAELVKLAPETNFKFLLFCEAPQPETFVDAFEEALVV